MQIKNKPSLDRSEILRGFTGPY